MIKIEHLEVFGFETAIRGMRNPLNSWDKSDSHYGCGDTDCNLCKHLSRCFAEFHNHRYCIGENDLKLARKLIKAGPDHRKFLRMINVTMDISAPLYWWKEFDTYKVATVRNSCSTMHKIHSRNLTLDDFSCEHLLPGTGSVLQMVIDTINFCRNKFIQENDKNYWYQMIQLLPSSYNQRSTVQLNYEVLRNMYFARKNHKLDEWREFCEIIHNLLPYFKEICIDSTEELN